MITKQKDGHFYIKRAKWEKRKFCEYDKMVASGTSFTILGLWIGFSLGGVMVLAEGNFIGGVIGLLITNLISWIIYFFVKNKRVVIFERIK
jgi:hypothetical protein